MRAMFFGDVPNRLAGAQRSLLAVLEMLPTVGIEPTIVFPAEGLFVSACRKAKVDVRVLAAPPAFQMFGRALTRMSSWTQLRVMLSQGLPYAVRLARLLDELEADVIHFNTGRGAVMAGLASPISGRNAVLHVRGYSPVARKYWVAAQAMASWFVLVSSVLEGELLPSRRRRSRIVHNGVEMRPVIARAEARQDVSTKFGLTVAADSPVFLSLSSLVPLKGIHHLLEAAARAKNNGVRAHYWLAGSGVGDAYEMWLRRRATELNLDEEVHWLGFVSDPYELLCAADALVLSSVELEMLEMDGKRVEVGGKEGLPRSILEAMAAGLPVIATNLGGVPEQICDGQNGILVPPSDSLALAEAIVAAVGDPGWRERAGQLGRTIVQERFTVEKATNGLADVLAIAAQERPLFAQPAHLIDLCSEGFAELRRAD